jgi:hypothetical protein
MVRYANPTSTYVQQSDTFHVSNNLMVATVKEDPIREACYRITSERHAIASHPRGMLLHYPSTNMLVSSQKVLVVLAAVVCACVRGAWGGGVR